MNKQQKKRRRWPYVTAGVVVASLLAFFLLWMFYNSKLGLIQYNRGSHSIDASVSIPAEENDESLPDMGQAPKDAEQKSQLPTGDPFYDKDVVNILLLGTDERTEQFSDNARADSIMILSLNTKKHTIKLVSIERGIGVPVPGRNDDLITHTFRYGGAALTLKTMRECFNVDVERYVRVNFSVFQKAIDAIGGVDITLTQAEADYLMNAKGLLSLNNNTIHDVVVGQNHLDGSTALAYSRIRKIDSDWSRIQRQRNMIQAAINQVKSEDIFTLNNLADTVLPMIETNLTKEEITSLLFELPGFISTGANMEQMTIPTYETCWNSVGVDGRKMIGVDFAANAQILKDFFY